MTSNDAALSVPDWPLSWGRVVPVLEGGIRYEFAHRVAALVVTILTAILAFRVRTRLAWIALATVVAQAALGGVLVRFLDPKAGSIAHAALAQLFFGMTVLLWLESRGAGSARSRQVRPVPIAAAAALFAQSHPGRRGAARRGGSDSPCRRRDRRHRTGHVGIISRTHHSHGQPHAPPSGDAPAFDHVLADFSGNRRVDVAPGQPQRATAHADDGAVHGGACGGRVAGIRRRDRIGRRFAPICTRISVAAPGRDGRRLMRDYIDLTKPRITWLILMSTGIGYFFGLPKAHTWLEFLRHIPLLPLFHTILGTGLIASGTAALNQWYEREADRKMRRTADRPLPAGRLTSGRALAFGVALSIAGFGELWAGRQFPLRRHRTVHTGQLPVPLYPDEDAHLVEHHCGRGPGRDASGDRFRSGRGYAEPRCAGAGGDPLPLAISAFLFDRVDVQRRLRARRNPHAPGGGAGRTLHRAPDRALRHRPDSGVAGAPRCSAWRAAST